MIQCELLIWQILSKLMFHIFLFPNSPFASIDEHLTSKQKVPGSSLRLSVKVLSETGIYIVWKKSLKLNLCFGLTCYISF